jgi:hypothetical protein
MTRRRWVIWLAALAVLGGCASEANSGGAAGGDRPDRLHQQARAALDRYDEALARAGGAPRFVPVGEPGGQVGQWEMSNGQNKAALANGCINSTTALPGTPPPPGTVTWESGATETLPVISADKAFTELTAARTGGCGGLVPLELTGARLATARIQTTRGPATAPAWEFTLKGTAVKVSRVAVAASATVTVIPPSWNPNDPPEGLAIDAATVTGTGTQLTVTFTGSPGKGSEKCGAEYTAEALESTSAVVVLLTEHAQPPAAGEGCTMIGAPRTATVRLARPLGERAVLDVRQGLPVKLTVAE